MAYKIDIEQIEHPLLRPLLDELIPVFADLEIHFFVVGATARDILSEIYELESGRRTQDIDIAIAIEKWERFNQIEKHLLELNDFSKDSHQKQRFIYKEQFQVDLIPYGAVAEKRDKIFWPPDQNIAMSVLGYDAIAENLITVDFGNGLEIKVASLVGIFLLKLMAWRDRHTQGNKDAEDIGFILQNYISINTERAVMDHYDAIYQMEDYSIVKASASLLGIDLCSLLEERQEAITEVKQLIEVEINKEMESPLFNQIIETNAISFEEVKKGFELLHKHLD